MEDLTEITEQLEQMIEQKKFPLIRPLLSEYNPVDIAEILQKLELKDLPLVFRLLPKGIASEIFVEMDDERQAHLINTFSDSELKDVIEDLYLDDAADILEEMPSDIVKRILKQTHPEFRQNINALLNYPKDSAGSIMTPEYVSLSPDMTTEEAFAKIRKTGTDKETIYTLYVTDNGNVLRGITTVRSLLLCDKDAKIADIMQENFISVNTSDDKEDVAEKIRRYGLIAIPVVDKEGRMVGIVTVDDAMDVMREESSEDISLIAGVTPADKPYLKTGVFRIWLSRLPWLLILMISATFTGLIINRYEGRLNALSPVLFACIPMLMDTGGNAGSQASVTIIRGIALNEIRFKDILKVIFKEIRVGVLLALAVAAACFGKLLLIDNLLFGYDGYTVKLSAIVSLALFFTIILAKLTGCVLPLVAKACRLDPAIVASPFITTIVDALSLIIFCNISLAVLA